MHIVVPDLSVLTWVTRTAEGSEIHRLTPIFRGAEYIDGTNTTRAIRQVVNSGSTRYATYNPVGVSGAGH